ncbi:MAG: hypothetical protein HC802_22960 [Caldilineaceae bacterium]|nr:hypothetical protein [Caldilineaceae bacterium]
MLIEAGFRDVQASAVCEAFGSVESVRYWGMLNSQGIREEIHRAQIEQLGLADEGTIAEMSRAWEQWTENPDAFLCRHMVRGGGLEGVDTASEQAVS